MKKLLLTFSMIFFVTACHSNNLAGSVYKLTTSTEEPPFTLAFDKGENRFYGKAVNNYFGSYKTQENKLSLSQTGATMMMASPQEMAAERQYFKDLSEVESYQLNQNTLILTLKNGQRLIFEKTTEPIE